MKSDHLPFRSGFLYLSTVGNSGPVTLWPGDLPCALQGAGSLRGLRPLGASSSSTAVTTTVSPDTVQCVPGDKIAPRWESPHSIFIKISFWKLSVSEWYVIELPISWVAKQKVLNLSIVFNSEKVLFTFLMVFLKQLRGIARWVLKCSLCEEKTSVTHPRSRSWWNQSSTKSQNCC